MTKLGLNHVGDFKICSCRDGCMIFVHFPKLCVLVLDTV